MDDHERSDAVPIGAFFAGLTAAVAGVMTYGPLSIIEFDLFFVSDVSVARLVGDWSRVARFTSAAVFGLTTAIAYYAFGVAYRPPQPYLALLALIGGILGTVAVIALIYFLLATISLLMLLYGLFFGPGDR